MKKFTFTLALVVLISLVYSQPLTGIKTIKRSGGNFSTFSAAISSLNSNGVGTGGVIFDVDSNFTDTAVNLTINTSSSTSANSIVFRKKGSGNNPKIYAGTGTGTMDAFIKIAGTDFITFDGINLSESTTNTTTTTQMEWGYAIVKGSASNGSKYVIIKNCVVSMNKVNTSSVGIYMGNHLATSTSTLTVADTNGINAYCKIFNDTILNVYTGISLTGYNASPPYDLYDKYNSIGADGSIYISNFGGGSIAVNAVYGIYQNNLKIANLTISGGNNTNNSINGILLGTGNNANVDIYNNTISLNFSAGTSTMCGIYNNLGGTATTSTINIYNNSIVNCAHGVLSISPLFYGIYNYAGSANIVNIYNNIVSGNVMFGGSNLYGIYSTSSTTLNMYGNRVYGNQKTGSGGSIYCYSASTSAVTFYNNKAYNNTISSGTGSLYGYYNIGSPTSENLYANKFYSMTSSGTGSIYGIYTNAVSTTIKNIYSDTINTLSTGGGTVYGIYNASGDVVKIYKNLIYNLNNSGSSAFVYGIYISSGTTVSVYNNFISELKAPSTSNAIGIAGLYFSGGTNIGAYYNTVYLNAASSSTTFGSAAIYASSTPNFDMRSNIFVNASTAGSAGKTVSFQRSNATISTYSTISNSNCLYAGTPSSSNLVFYDGTNSDQTMGTYKTRVSPRETYSFTENPPFVNISTAPYDLHLSTATATHCESGGFPIVSPVTITDDIDGNTRNVNFTDIGADEGNFTILDRYPPLFNYIPLSNTSSTTARTLVATILDPSGVPTSGSGLPKLYWKRFYNGSYSNVTATSLGSGQYSFSFGSGVSTGDTIYYYLAAQDNATVANVGTSPSTGAAGFTSNPPAASTPPTTLNAYKIIPSFAAGNYYIGGTGSTPGSGCTYVDLTDAFAAISGKEITGTVNLILTTYYSSSEEAAFPIVIDPIIGSGTTNLVTIKPNTSVNASISSSSTTSIIKFNGADFIVIDGSNNGSSSRNLVIQNTSTTASTSVIWYASQGTAVGCVNNTIKNCSIKAGDKTVTNFGIFVAGTSISTTGSGDDNDNLVFQNNIFQKAYYGIYAVASLTGLNNNMTISNNVFGDTSSVNTLGKYGIYEQYARNLSISQNTISNFVSTISNPTGVFLGNNVDSSVINRNVFNNIKYTGTSGYGGKAILVSTNISNAALTISNNVIFDISGDGWSTFSSDAIAGIMLSGTGSGIKIWYNSINLSGNISRSLATADKSAAIYTGSTVSGLDMRNNTFTNSLFNTTGTAKAYSVYTDAVSNPFTNINFNDYFISGNQGTLAFAGTDITTMAGIRAFSGMDASSISSNPLYNASNNLIPAINSPLLAAGTYISSVLTDYTGTSRSTSTPTIGAYENGGDFSGPAISFTAFNNTSSTTARTLNTTITDASGVPTSGSGLPRLFWKKNYSGTYNTVTASFAGSSQFNFTFGSGVAANDTVFYYILAQDNYSTPNISGSPAGASGLTANPPAATILPPSPYFYKIIGTLAAGNYNIGGTGITPASGCTYVDLTAAFKDINNKEIAGAINLLLTSHYNSSEEDTFPIVINPVAGSSSTNTVTIKPAAGNSDSISGSSSSSIIKLNGADNIIINGSNNNSNSRNLLIENTATTGSTAVVWVASAGTGNGCSGNIIKNCFIKGGDKANTTGFGIYSGGNTISTTGLGDDNDNLTIQNNVILKNYYGIYSVASANGLNNALNINSNIIGDTSVVNGIGKYGIYLNFCRDASVYQNTIFNLNGTITNPTGIYLSSGVDSSSFYRNSISGIKYTGTSGYGGKGIDLVTTNPNLNLVFSNNLIYDISGDGWTTLTSDAIIGFRITGTGSGIKLYFNTINLFGNVSRTSSGDKSTALYIGTGMTGIDCRNNSFNNTIINTTSLSGQKSYTVYTDATASPFSIINYNNYYASGSQAMLGYLLTDIYSLVSWKIATTQDSGSFPYNPLFISNTNLVPASGYMNKTAVSINGITVDYNGTTRSTTPDIGAFEFKAKPNVYTYSATSVASTTATLRGVGNAVNEGTLNLYFDYGPTASFGTRVNGSPATTTGVSGLYTTASVSGLNPSTLYHSRIVGINLTDTVYGTDSVFTTTGIPPVVITESAGSITTNSAVLHGTINASNSSTTTGFQYGLTTSYGNTVTAIPSPVTGNTNTSVSASISGLNPNTTYHFRAKGTNGSGTVYGYDSTFTTNAIPPTVITRSAVTVASNSATLRGQVNANNAVSKVVFDWGLTTSYGFTDTATQSPVSGATLVTVSFNLAGLVANTTYHFRVRAFNSAGSANGTDSMFTTLPLQSVVTTDSSNSITTTSAMLYGTVNAKNSATTVTFQYGTTISYGAFIGATPGTVNGNTNTTVDAAILGLLPNTTYHFRVVGVNVGGTSNGNDLTFSTGKLVPLAITQAATAVSTSSATLYASVTANNDSTTVTFQWGTSMAYGNTVNGAPYTVKGMTATSITYALSGLTNNTTYHYRVVAVNSSGTVYGKDTSFKTGNIPPIAKTTIANPVTMNTATLNGLVNANSNSTVVTFEYGLTTSYGYSVTATQSPVTGNTNTAVSASISGLVAHTWYYFRVVATNIAGTVYGADSLFITSDTLPTLTTASVVSITQTTAVSGGNITNNGGANISQRGVCWSTSPNPTTALSTKTNDGPGTGVFSSNLTGLSQNTTYYVRAYAVNLVGTVYANELSFTTLKTGIKEDNLAVTIYSGAKTVYISFSQPDQKGGKFFITDAFGREILNGVATGLNNEIDMSAFASGCYIVKIISGNKLYTAKLFIQ